MNKKNCMGVLRKILMFLFIYMCIILVSSVMIIGLKDTIKLKFLSGEIGIIRNSFYVVIALAFTVIFELVLKSSKKDNKVDKIFWAILILSLCVIFYNFIIGNAYYMYYDIGSDTKDQYFPYFLNEVLNLKDGMFSTWNFQYGLGESLFSVNAWTFDIFSMILVLVSFIIGASKLQYFLVWMQILKIIVVFILSKKYLSYFLKDRTSICLASYLSAMNGFLFLWGQHYFLGTSCVYILLMLCAIEYFLAKKSKKSLIYLALSTASLLIFSYYIAYMVLAVSGIYFVFRYIYIQRKIEIKPMITSFGKCLYGVIIGMLLSGIIFVPSCYHILTSSSRLSDAGTNIFTRIVQSFTHSFNFDYVQTRLSRLMSNNLLCMNDNVNYQNTNYYELPQLFCTIFIIFFLVQWIIYEFKKSKTKKDYTFFVLKLVALYLLIFNGVSGLILNAFAYEAYRYTYLAIPFLALIVGIVFEKVIKENKINIWGLIISAGLSIGVWWISYQKVTIENINVAQLMLIFLIIGFIVLMFINKKNKHSKVFMGIFIFLIISTTIFDDYITTNHRKYKEASDFPLIWNKSELIDDTGKAVSWIKENDKSFYRIEEYGYSNISTFGDPFIYQLPSTTWYNTTSSEDICEFYDKVYPNANFLKYYKITSLKDEADLQALYLLNSKYILTKGPIDIDGVEEINRFGEVYVYNNTKTNSIAKWYTKTITKDEFAQLEGNERNSKLYDYVITNDSIKLDENARATVSEFNLIKQTELTGNVMSEGTGLLMLSVPAQEGWNVYIDDELVENYKVDYGFIGVVVPTGEHEIKLKYSVPKIEIGIIFSCIGLINLAIIIILIRKNEKDKVDLHIRSNKIDDRKNKGNVHKK